MRFRSFAWILIVLVPGSGSVDRLVHRGNHDTLFYFMAQHAGRVRSWLRAHGVIAPGGPGPGAVPDMLAP